MKVWTVGLAMGAVNLLFTVAERFAASTPWAWPAWIIAAGAVGNWIAPSLGPCLAAILVLGLLALGRRLMAQRHRSGQRSGARRA